MGRAKCSYPRKQGNVPKWLLIVTLVERCESALYNLQYHLFEDKVRDIRCSETLCVLNNRTYEHFNLHINQASRISSERKQTEMMGTVNVGKRN